LHRLIRQHLPLAVFFIEGKMLISNWFIIEENKDKTGTHR
jgi:hypothetical protein